VTALAAWRSGVEPAGLPVTCRDPAHLRHPISVRSAGRSLCAIEHIRTRPPGQRSHRLWL